MWRHVERRKSGNHRSSTTKSKQQRTSSYACHIFGLNRHKMIDCPKFTEMQKLFHGKSMVVIKVQPIVETQIITANVNVVDVNVTTRSKTSEEQLFKDREPRKAKSVANLEKEKRLKKSMVETI
jgi:hypothetical protein